MGKRNLIIIITAISITLISGIVFTSISFAGDKASSRSDTSSASHTTPGSHVLGTLGNNNDDFTYIPPTLENANNSDLENTDPDIDADIPFVPATEIDLDITSTTVFVNKEYALPKDYKPTNLVVANVLFDLQYFDERTLMRPEAASALEKLFSAAKEDGIILYGVSGYRSYDRQYKIFTDNIIKKGKTHTLRYSAVPGTSEHQTGLAIDVSTKALGFKLITTFADSPEGMWLAENAHLFGYIIRYPKDKATITGYAYEPWHIRYVGKGLSNYLYTNQLTLDEYYHYTPSVDFDFETLYADLINFLPPAVTIIPTEIEGVIVGEDGAIVEDVLDDGIEPTKGAEENDPKDETSEEPAKDDPKGEPSLPQEEDAPAEDGPTEDPKPEELPGGTDSGEGGVDTDIPDDDNTDPTTQDPDQANNSNGSDDTPMDGTDPAENGNTSTNMESTEGTVSSNLLIH